MQVDWLFWVSIAAQCLLALLGVAMTLYDDWAKRSRVPIVIVFSCLLVVGIVSTNQQAARSAAETSAAQARLSASLENLESATEDIARLQELTTSLQERLLSSNATIEQLSRQGINTVTGGDSFAYLSFPLFGANSGYPAIVHVGDYPLYDVKARLFDPVKYDELASRQPNNKLGNLLAAGPTLDIGELATHHVWTSTKAIPFSGSERQDFNIFFSARSGFWHQNLSLRRVDDNWVSALRVFRRDDKEATPIYEKIDSQFPTTPSGEVDWPK